MVIQEISLYVGLAIAVIAGIFSIYDRFTKPDIKAASKIGILEQGCALKHSYIDKSIGEINKRFELLEENHIRHIEADVRSINNTQSKILGVLEAKYQIKIDDR